MKETLPVAEVTCCLKARDLSRAVGNPSRVTVWKLSIDWTFAGDSMQGFNLKCFVKNSLLLFEFPFRKKHGAGDDLGLFGQ